MRSNRRTNHILATVIALFVLVIVIVLMIYLYRSMHKLKSVSLVPNFSETELKADTDYLFIIKTEPYNADIKSIKYNIDDPSSIFKEGTGPHKAELHTGGAGTITMYVNVGDIESEKISFTVTDPFGVAETAVEDTEDAEPAGEEAVSETEAVTEPEPEPVRTVTVTGDNVRMRSEPNTDCEVVKTCSKGETYNLIEVTGEWTGVDNNGQECYIKTEFLEETVQEPVADTGDDKSQDNTAAGANTDNNANTVADNATGNTGGSNTADKPAGADTVIGEGMVEVECKDGKAMFTQAEYDYFVATWSYTGMADKMMTHHTADELHKLYKNTH